MGNKLKFRLVVLLLLVVITSISACGSKKATPVVPISIPTSTPAEPIVYPTAHIILRNFDCTIITDVPQTECEALVILYNTSNGDGWNNNTGWLSSTPVGNWYGVTIKAGHVTSLDLSNNQLKGYIPSEIGNITTLRVLALSFNQLTGSIPASFGSLTNLTHLYLSSNQLSGGVPADLGNLLKLQALNIYDNQLSGNLPVSLINLTALSNFNFYGTTLCEPTTDDYQTWKTTVPQYGSTGVICQ